MIGTALRLFASWWLVEFASGAAGEWRAISADRRAQAAPSERAATWRHCEDATHSEPTGRELVAAGHLA